MDGWARVFAVVAGLLLVAGVLAFLACCSGVVHGELSSLAVVSVLVVSSCLVGEALGIAPAILEIMLGFAAALVGLEPSGTLDLLALVGGVLLMFSAGVEVDLALLRRYLARSIVVGLASFGAPFACTGVALYLLGYGVREALLCAVAVSTTSVAVVYAIIRGAGLTGTVKGQVMLASAMVADMVSILVFVALVVEASWALLAYGVMLVVLPVVFEKVLRRIPAAYTEPEIRAVMALLLVVALLSEVVGVHAILFAFILGMVVREALHARQPLPEKVNGIVFGFLSPIFFVNAGLHAGHTGLHPSLLPLSIILLAASFPAKVIATHLTLSRLAGVVEPRYAVVFGARLTVSTVIAYTGLVKGVLDPELAASIMLTALVATLAAGLAAGWRQVERSIELEEDVVVALEE